MTQCGEKRKSWPEIKKTGYSWPQIKETAQIAKNREPLMASFPYRSKESEEWKEYELYTALVTAER